LGTRCARLTLLVLSAALCHPASSQSTGASGGAYREVPWPIPAKTAAGTPSPWYFGEVAAVATTKEGHILVLHRGANPLMEFDAGGKFLRSWGDGVISEGKVTRVEDKDRAPGASGYSAVYGPAGCYACGAHSVRVDPQGNIWVVDATAHVVYKMDAQWRVLLQLGVKGVSGSDSTHFNLPTDVAFAPNGDLYVSDGYAGARVVKFSAGGKYLLEWGKRGTGPGEFGLPHNVVVDAQGRVYVTDRDNRRIQVFDAQGKFLSEWKDTGGVSTLFLTKDQHIWTGGVLRNLKGEVVARLPGNPGGHGTTVTASGDVLIAQLSRTIQKFVKQ
jgi:DNA-binding beta-propeller fold protein YncE